MYAIFEMGGKQYKVAPGEVFSVEKQKAQAGEKLELKPICLVQEDGVLVTGDGLKTATVTATVLEHGRGPKLMIFKYKNKTNYRRRQGHRQDYTKLQLEVIKA